MIDVKAILDSLLGLKALPLWIFLALAVSGYACLYVPQLAGVDVQGFRLQYGGWFWFDAVTMTVFAIFSAANLLVRYVSARLVRKIKKRRVEEQRRFYKVYAPAYELLHDFCTSESRFVGAPYLRQRVENAFKMLKVKSDYSSRWKRAWYSLFDKQVSNSYAENEYGDKWPIDDLGTITKRNLRFSDKKLVELYNKANMSRLDQNPHPTVLLLPDSELREYIHKQHDILKICLSR